MSTGTHSVHPDRIHTLKEGVPGPGPVVYWMSREQRIPDNWGLLHAQDLALERNVPLMVCFCLVPAFLEAGARQYEFMLQGLEETAREARRLNISFRLLMGDPTREVARLVRTKRASILVTDFDPLRIKRTWQSQVAEEVPVPVIEVDGHNIVPCRRVSPKQEYAARTIRPKLHRLLPEFLTPFPKPVRHPVQLPKPVPLPDWDAARDSLQAGSFGPALKNPVPGTAAGMLRLKHFLTRGLAEYGRSRNDPTADALSGLSPYHHFGQVAPQRSALMALELGGHHPEAREDFLEQLVVRRELTDNFCLHNPNYDTLTGIPDWARATLDAHRDDPREFLYDADRFEAGETHDPLWNAAQMEMVRSGTMHGYMRMYWAKKILEWSASPEEAVDHAIRLNDRYELDGRDPNGYVGVLWAVGGVHDRPWKERPVFGKIRYMNFAGCKRKFDVNAYIAMWNT
jgi:deoxyribodipyrimidine photo-lyase